MSCNTIVRFTLGKTLAIIFYTRYSLSDGENREKYGTVNFVVVRYLIEIYHNAVFKSKIEICKLLKLSTILKYVQTNLHNIALCVYISYLDVF